MLIHRARDVKKCLKNIGSFTDKQAKVLDWDCDTLEWISIQITPREGPYRGGKYEFKITFGKYYPKQPPQVDCMTPIYHPNIDMTGEDYNVCLSLFDEWQASFGLEDVIQGILFLMYNPNLDDPLSPWFDPSMNAKEFEENLHKTLRGQFIEDAINYQFPKMIEGDSKTENDSKSETPKDEDLKDFNSTDEELKDSNPETMPINMATEVNSSPECEGGRPEAVLTPEIHTQYGEMDIQSKINADLGVAENNSKGDNHKGEDLNYSKLDKCADNDGGNDYDVIQENNANAIAPTVIAEPGAIGKPDLSIDEPDPNVDIKKEGVTTVALDSKHVDICNNTATCNESQSDTKLNAEEKTDERKNDDNEQNNKELDSSTDSAKKVLDHDEMVDYIENTFLTGFGELMAIELSDCDNGESDDMSDYDEDSYESFGSPEDDVSDDSDFSNEASSYLNRVPNRSVLPYVSSSWFLRRFMDIMNTAINIYLGVEVVSSINSCTRFVELPNNADLVESESGDSLNSPDGIRDGVPSLISSRSSGDDYEADSDSVDKSVELQLYPSDAESESGDSLNSWRSEHNTVVVANGEKATFTDADGNLYLPCTHFDGEAAMEENATILPNCDSSYVIRTRRVAVGFVAMYAVYKLVKYIAVYVKR